MRLFSKSQQDAYFIICISVNQIAQNTSIVESQVHEREDIFNLFYKAQQKYKILSQEKMSYSGGGLRLYNGKWANKPLRDWKISKKLGNGKNGEKNIRNVHTFYCAFQPKRSSV